jgi:two-component system, LytTR family, response regulator
MRIAGAVTLAARLSALLADSAGRSDGAATVAPGERPTSGRLAVPTETGELLLDAVEIHWIAARDYHAVVHARGKTYRVRESLAALEARLDPARFVRVHRSAIVQLDQVRELLLGAAGAEASVVLRDGTRVPVSRRRVAQVRSLL